MYRSDVRMNTGSNLWRMAVFLNASAYDGIRTKGSPDARYKP